MKKIYRKLENFSGFFPNFSFFMSSHFISYFFSFFIIILFARQYSIDIFGKFTIAQTVFSIIYSVSFSNIHYYLNKSLSSNFQNRRKDLASCFIITFYSSVFLYLILSVLIALMGLESDIKNAILLLNLILLSQPFAIFHSEIFVRGQFGILFKIKLIQNIIFFTIKIFIIYNKLDYLYLAFAYFLENLFFSSVIVYYFKKNGNNFKNLIFSKAYTINILRKIILFPLLAFAFLISMRIDVLMISSLLGVESSGYYSANSRIITIVLLFGTHFFQFIFPNLNRINFDQKKFNEIYTGIILLSFIVGISCFVLTLIFGKYYLYLFGPEFLVGLNSLKILSLNVGIALIINAWVHKQYLNSRYGQILFFQGCTVILNILFNYYLINLLGISGAAFATLFSAFFAFMIVNISQPKEFLLISSSFDLNKIKDTANVVLRIIFVKKNPEKLEKIND
jgi:O-antigen/teichoic acid export membrane protein